MYLTVKELQELLKIGRTATYHLIHMPGFPIIKIGNTYRIRKEDLDKYLNHLKNQYLYLYL